MYYISLGIQKKSYIKVTSWSDMVGGHVNYLEDPQLIVLVWSKCTFYSDQSMGKLGKEQSD